MVSVIKHTACKIQRNDYSVIIKVIVINIIGFLDKGCQEPKSEALLVNLQPS